MNREEIIRMAREAGFNVEQGFLLRVTGIDEDLERFAALVIAEKEKQIIAANAPEIERINTYIKELEEAVAAERNKVAQWMIERGYATGHGDTTEDLLREAEWQIRESQREASAKSIRARGNT
jgi:O-methyltransferase involved in polyketide biosynthesis